MDESPDVRERLDRLERELGELRDRRWHFTSQVTIALDGDVAEVESYNLSMAAPAAPTAPTAEFTQFAGYYLDRLERRAGRWGIARRKHLLVAASTVRETPLEGALSALNAIGATSNHHADHRRLSRADALWRIVGQA